MGFPPGRRRSLDRPRAPRVGSAPADRSAAPSLLIHLDVNKSVSFAGLNDPNDDRTIYHRSYNVIHGILEPRHADQLPIGRYYEPTLVQVECPQDPGNRRLCWRRDADRSGWTA